MIDPKIFVRRFRETLIDLKNEAGIDIGMKVSGKYLVEVCRDGKVIRQPFGPKMRPNLFVNNFFDSVMTGSAVDLWKVCFQYAQVGTSTTTPANADIKLTTASQATNSLFSGGGNTFSNDTTNGACTWTWVFEFAAVGAGITYNEAGLAQNASLTTPGLSTHILFPSGVVLNSGDNVRLTYSITFSIPSLITPITVSMAAVNGFNVSGSMKVCGTFANIFGIVSSGDINVINNSPNSAIQKQLNFGQQNALPALGSAPTTFAGVNTSPSFTAISGAQGSGLVGTYTNGTFTRNQTFTWTPSQPATTASNVQNIFLVGSGQTIGGLYLILTSAQTKANTNTLAITLSCTMARA